MGPSTTQERPTVSIHVVTIGRNEAERHLERYLACVQTIVSSGGGILAFTDDASNDNTADMVKGYGGKIKRLAEPQWLKNESVARQLALDHLAEYARAGDWVLSLDCDETVTHPDQLTTICRQADEQGAGVIHLPLYEFWDDSPPRFRVDGLWFGSQTRRLWKYDPDRNFIRKRQFACGSEPEFTRSIPAMGQSNIKLLHWGYVRPEDRVAKHTTYTSRAGGHGHKNAHVESIITEPVLADWITPLSIVECLPSKPIIPTIITPSTPDLRTTDLGFGEHYFTSLDNGAGYQDSVMWEDLAVIVKETLVHLPDRDLTGKANLLDMGCAHGYLIRHLRRRGVEAWGTDVSTYALSQAPEDTSPYLRLFDLTGDRQADHIAGFPFDLLTCFETLEHIPQEHVTSALKHLYRALKPGGRSILTICTDLQPGWDSDPTHVTIKPHDWWTERLSLAGFIHDDATATRLRGFHLFRHHDGVYAVTKP